MSDYPGRLAALRKAYNRWHRCERILAWEDRNGPRQKRAKERGDRWVAACVNLYRLLSNEHNLPPRVDGAPFHWDGQTWADYSQIAEDRLASAIRHAQN